GTQGYLVWPVTPIYYLLYTGPDKTDYGVTFVSPEDAGLQPLTPHQAQMATLAFQLWDDLIIPSLVPGYDPGKPGFGDGFVPLDTDIGFAYSTTTDNNGNYTNQHFQHSGSNDGIEVSNLFHAEVWINGNQARNANAALIVGGAGFADVYIHEIGHAL